LIDLLVYFSISNHFFKIKKNKKERKKSYTNFWIVSF